MTPLNNLKQWYNDLEKDLLKAINSISKKQYKYIKIADYKDLEMEK